MSRRDFRTVRDYAISDDIKPLLAGVYPPTSLGRAQEDFEKKDFIGKLVVKIN